MHTYRNSRATTCQRANVFRISSIFRPANHW